MRLVSPMGTVSSPNEQPHCSISYDAALANLRTLSASSRTHSEWSHSIDYDSPLLKLQWDYG